MQNTDSPTSRLCPSLDRVVVIPLARPLTATMAVANLNVVDNALVVIHVFQNAPTCRLPPPMIKKLKKL